MGRTFYIFGEVDIDELREDISLRKGVKELLQKGI